MYFGIWRKMNFSDLVSKSWLTFMLYLQLGIVTSSDNTKRVTSNSLATTKFNHLAILPSGDTIIGAVNHLYRLTSDLELLANVTTTKDFHSNCYNNILLVDSRNCELISCSSSDAYRCAKYNYKVSSALTIITNQSLGEILENDAHASTVAFINMGYNCNNGQQIPKLYVAVSYSDYSHKKPAISIRSLNSNRFLKKDYDNEEHGNITESFFTKYRDKYKVNYIYGFNSGNYNYFLTNQKNSIPQGRPYISKLIRICSDCKSTSIWRGYTEIPIECELGVYEKNKSYNLVQAAHLSPIGDVLYGVFSESEKVSSNKPSENSALCVYSMNAINEKFQENIKNCFRELGNRGFGDMLKNSQCSRGHINVHNICTSDRNMPLDGTTPIKAYPAITFSTLLTAIISKPNAHSNDIFVGTNTGHLKRIVLNSKKSACEHADLTIEEGSPVNSDLLLAPKGTHLYVMTEHTLTKIEIPLMLKTCSAYSDYNTCMSSCNHCDCSLIQQSLWYQYDFRKVVNISMSGSNEFQIGAVESLQFNVTNSQLYQQLYCVFTIGNKTFQTIYVYCNSYESQRNNCHTHCQMPKVVDIPKIPRDMHYLNATLSIRTTYITDVAMMNIAFFDCNKYSSCETCVSSMFSCYWNTEGRKCDYINDKKEDKNTDLLIKNLTMCKYIDLQSSTLPMMSSYKCKDVAHDCISCLRLKIKFNCGWCPNKNTCEFLGNYTDQMMDNHDICPGSSPLITSFWPQVGLQEGGTTVTISGRNLGNKFEDIHDIKVAGVACIPYQFVPPQQIICKINKSSQSLYGEGPVEVNVNRTLSTSILIKSTQNFKFVNLKIMDIFPKKGSIYGGDVLTIRGENLDAATSTTVFIGNTSCMVFSRDSSTIQCITNSSYTEREDKIFMKFDNSFHNLTSSSFKYVRDEQRDKNGFNKEPKGIPAGGVKILIRDVNPQPISKLLLHIQDGKQMYNSSCEIKNDSKTAWICLSPFISHIDSSVINVEKPREMNVSFIDHTANSSKFFIFKNQPYKFLLYPNPQFYYFFNSSVEFGEDYFVIIKGKNINMACQKTDINVKVGNHNCEVISISSNQVICQLCKSSSSGFVNAFEQKYDILAEHDHITLFIGGNFNVTIHKQKMYTSDNSMKIYISCSVIVFVLVLGLVVCHYIIRKDIVAKSLKKLMKTQQQMTTLELCVASECKEAFAELQIQIPTFQTYESSTIVPFLNYNKYVKNILFPNINDYSIIVSGKAILIHKEEGLQLFKELIMNQRFLLLFVRILENERNFSMNDRVHVASMIMITLQKNMVYCTDILKTLMAELIGKYMRGKSHPKLLLRRTESVVEKMLSAWFSFLLYDFLNKSGGKPLFNLFNAIKKHVHKGPVDAITSQARYCLSENKLIRKKFDYHSLTIYICVSQKTAKIIELESAIEKVPVQALDCDTISQFKEKSSDALYHAISCTQSLNLLKLNVEWIPDSCSRIILADDDPSSITEGEWRQKNTLRHYGVPDGATLNLISDEEKKYRSLDMISGMERREPENNIKYKTTFSFRRTEKMRLIESTTPLVQGNDSHYKEWHLIKPYNPRDDNGNDQMVPEVYLTRLLATKTSLQNFVDELFNTIFKTTNQNYCFPIAIKYMFDFLDDQASKHNVSDPEVVHVWKNNLLPLRFWVNLIKNPNFLFDIHKSNIVDSCLSVIAQVLMDSCSTSEQHLTKDSSSTKLLYAKEIPIYHKLVKKYYADIKNMPKISSRDLTAMFEESKTYATDFDESMSLHELFKYGVRYKEKLINALKNDEILKDNLLALKFERLMEIMSTVSNL